MSSVLTAAERALIDGAVAAGRVRRIPPGATSLTTYVWCEIANDLVPAGESSAWCKSYRSEEARRLSDRHRDLLSRLQAGETVRQIAADWGVGLSTIRLDCRKLGLTLAPDGRLLSLLEAP